MSLRRTCMLAGCLALACLGACSQPRLAAGIEPVPGTGFIERRRQVPLPPQQADVAYIFVGGFIESLLMQFREIYELVPPLPCQGRQLRAYYAWDSGTGNLFFHSTWKLQRDLRAFWLGIRLLTWFWWGIVMVLLPLWMPCVGWQMFRIRVRCW